MDKLYPLIEHYGYLIVFLGVMPGTSGIPFPSAAILLASGVLVQQGHLDLGDAIVFGILGAIIGNQIGYWVGNRAGRPFVLKWGRYVTDLAIKCATHSGNDVGRKLRGSRVPRPDTYG